MYSGLSEKPEGGGREARMILGDRVNEEGEGRLIWESIDDSSPGTDSDHGEDRGVDFDQRALI
jgi:hypothetical protein